MSGGALSATLAAASATACAAAVLVAAVGAPVVAQRSGNIQLGIPQARLNWEVCAEAGTGDAVGYFTAAVPGPNAFFGLGAQTHPAQPSMPNGHDNTDYAVCTFDSSSRPRCHDFFSLPTTLSTTPPANGATACDASSFEYGQCQATDEMRGGINDVCTLNGTTDGVSTSFSWARKLNTGDVWDAEFLTGSGTLLNVAWNYGISLGDFSATNVGGLNNYSNIHCHDCPKPLIAPQCFDINSRACNLSNPTNPSGFRDGDRLNAFPASNRPVFWDGTTTLPACDVRWDVCRGVATTGTTGSTTAAAASTTGNPGSGAGTATTGAAGQSSAAAPTALAVPMLAASALAAVATL